MGVLVRERPKGSKQFWVFVNYQHRRIARKVGSKQAAQVVAAKLQAQLVSGEAHEVFRRGVTSTEPPTFAVLAAQWAISHAATRSIREGSAVTYQSHVRVHLEPHFGAMHVDAITAEKIEAFLAMLRATGSKRTPGQPLSAASVDGILKVLNLILSHAARRGVIGRNPIELIAYRREPRRSGADPFTPDELARLFPAAAKVDYDFGVFIELWPRLGCRAGEAMGLRPADIDAQAATAYIRRTYSRRKVGPPKTMASERRASFAVPLLEEPDGWRPSPAVAESMRRKLGALKRVPANADAFLFTDRSGQPWSSSTMRTFWQRALTLARVRSRVPEQLRHTAASLLLSRGAPLVFVLSQGGWRGPGVLFAHYARWMPSAADIALTPAPTRSPATAPQLRAVRRRATS
jgi:integrase